MATRSIVYIVGTGVLVGLLVAGIMTFLDWHGNPGSIFQGAGGTNWPAVRATAWSWFWPIALLGAAIAAPVTWFLSRRKPAASSLADAKLGEDSTE